MRRTLVPPFVSTRAQISIAVISCSISFKNATRLVADAEFEAMIVWLKALILETNAASLAVRLFWLMTLI